MPIYFGLPDGGTVSLKRRLERRQGCSTGAVVVDRRVLQAEGAHGYRAWPRRGDAGLGCLSVTPQSLYPAEPSKSAGLCGR